MSKRYTFTTPYKDAYEIVDRDIDKAMKPEDVADLLNQQDQQIAELKAENEGIIEELDCKKDYIDELETRNKELAKRKKFIIEQVCEKIREFAYDTFKEFGCFDETDLEHILDQIENEKESN